MVVERIEEYKGGVVFPVSVAGILIAAGSLCEGDDNTFLVLAVEGSSIFGLKMDRHKDLYLNSCPGYGQSTRRLFNTRQDGNEDMKYAG